MANVSITAANVLKSSGASTGTGTTGSTALTAGMPITTDSADSYLVKPSDANGAGDLKLCKGIALHASSPGQPIRYAKKDPTFTPGFTAAVGDVAYVSMSPAGAITVTRGDLTSGAAIITLGVMTSTTVMNLNPTIGGTI